MVKDKLLPISILALTILLVASSVVIVPVDARTRGKPYVDGKYVKVNGQTIWLRGVNGKGLLQTGRWSRYNVKERDYAQLERWGFNVMRRHFARNLWFNYAWYRQLIKQNLEWAAQHNIYLILDLYRWDHTIGPYDRKGSGMYMPPSKQAWAQLWVNMASQLKNYQNVIYELHNEPNYWKGPVRLTNAEYASWCQYVINKIREVDPDTIIVVAVRAQHKGAVAYFLAHPLTGGNIVYDFHRYRIFALRNEKLDFQYRSQLERWFDKWNLHDAFKKLPMLWGEFGAYTLSTAELKAVRNQLDACRDYGIHWTGWRWSTRSPFKILANHNPYRLTSYGKILYQLA